MRIRILMKHRWLYNFILWFDKINPIIRFLILLFVLSIIYEYPSLLVKRPQSAHHWRQSDCASLALNYYQHGMHFFQPQTHNLTSDNGKTGYVAPSEVPVGYYFIAILYKIFGYHDYIYRIVNTLIFLTGLFFLFKTLSLLVKGFFWPAFMALLFFTSPVLVYYGNNFLTDSSALALSLIAWHFFVKFYLTGKDQPYYTAMLFFLLAGMYKITALISLVAIACIFLLELTGATKFKPEGKLFTKPWRHSIPILLIAVIVGGWAMYARYYNNLHGTFYFSTGTFPLWSLNSCEVGKVWENVRVIWLNQYFHYSVLYLMLLVLITNLALARKNNRFLLSITLLLFLGTIIYVILWFSTFKDHDYYTINLYILLIVNMVCFCWLMNRHFPRVFHAWYIKILFLLFFSWNTIYANQQMRMRYYGWFTEYPEYKDYHTITPYLRSIGIRQSDTVICLPDNSHVTLYLMNQRGWTTCLGYNRDSISILSSVKRGARYLIVNGNGILALPYLQHFMTNPIGHYGNIRIFKLDHYDNYVNHKFYVKPQKISLLCCGAEKVTDDKNSFWADSGRITLEGGYTQSAEKAFTGCYSARLTKTNAYAFTCKFKGVELGEHFIVSVCRYSPEGNGVLVATANDLREFYLNSPTRIEKLRDGWERLTLDFYVPVRTSDGVIAMYVWNDGESPVYFDDFVVKRYDIK